jgi:hypothetical protein
VFISGASTKQWEVPKLIIITIMVAVVVMVIMVMMLTSNVFEDYVGRHQH